MVAPGVDDQLAPLEGVHEGQLLRAERAEDRELAQRAELAGDAGRSPPRHRRTSRGPANLHRASSADGNARAVVARPGGVPGPARGLSPNSRSRLRMGKARREGGPGVAMISEGRFAGRRAVVTGGASGIGRAVAERLAAEGARVAVWDRDAAGAEAVAAAIDGLPVPLDITDWPAVEAAATRTTGAFGGIDVLVCSAGIAGATVPVVDFRWRSSARSSPSTSSALLLQQGGGAGDEAGAATGGSSTSPRSPARRATRTPRPTPPPRRR